MVYSPTHDTQWPRARCLFVCALACASALTACPHDGGGSAAGAAGSGNAGSSNSGASGSNSAGSSGATNAGASGSSNAGASGSSDGGASGASGVVDTGSSLRAGEVSLLGITHDGEAVYTVAAAGGERSIEAVPLAGGSPSVIGNVSADADVSVTGNAVAFWTGISASSSMGTLGIWTKAGGLKPNVATKSLLHFVASSEDGSKIAVSFNSTTETTEIAVTTPEDPAVVANGTTAIIGNVYVGSTQCVPSYRFVANTFVSAHCSGPTSLTTPVTDASLVLVRDVPSPAAQWLIDADADPTTAIQPWWGSDATAQHFAVADAFRDVNSRRIGHVITVTNAGSTIVNIEDNTKSAFLSDDGATIYYRLATEAFRSAPTTGNLHPPQLPDGAVTLVSDGTAGSLNILAVTNAKTWVLFHSSVPVPDQNGVLRTDLRLVDTVTPAQTIRTLVNLPIGVPVGFTADNRHVVYLSQVNDAGIGKLAVQILSNETLGAQHEVATGVGLARLLAQGTEGVFFTPTTAGQGATGDLELFDAATYDADGCTGCAPPPAPITLAIAVDPYFEVWHSTLVYTRSGSGGGLYALNIP